MNAFFLDLGLSWTLSKILPYALCVLLGVLMFIILRKRMAPGYLRKLMSLVLIVPFGIYFMFNPIYEGDFSNNFRYFNISDSLTIHESTLTVIAIPNCQFCAESIERLNKIVERTENKEVNFVVLSSDIKSIDSYLALADPGIHISIDTNFRMYESITLGQYPTFIYSEKKKLRVWGNDGFGVRATDWIETKLSK